MVTLFHYFLYLGALVVVMVMYAATVTGECSAHLCDVTACMCTYCVRIVLQ